MENRIKEQQNYLFADRLSTSELRASMSAIAYVLMAGLPRLALGGTQLAGAQCHTIRERLIKIGARVNVTARRVWVHMSEVCLMKDVILGALARRSLGLPRSSPG